jgi:hypothetical protein
MIEEKGWHDTTRPPKKKLEKYNKKAHKQQDIIREFFIAHPHVLYSPEDIHRILFDYDTPLTSIRRAITNLTDAGYLVKTRRMKRGKYGVDIHTWVYIPEYAQRKIF